MYSTKNFKHQLLGLVELLPFQPNRAFVLPPPPSLLVQIKNWPRAKQRRRTSKRINRCVPFKFALCVAAAAAVLGPLFLFADYCSNWNLLLNTRSRTRMT